MYDDESPSWFLAWINSLPVKRHVFYPFFILLTDRANTL